MSSTRTHRLFPADRRLAQPSCFSAKVAGVLLALAWLPAAVEAGAGNDSAGPRFTYFREIQKSAAANQARLLLAASTVDGKESDRTVALRHVEGEVDYAVSLETLAAVLDLVAVAQVEGGFRIQTPLGRAEFVPADITSDRGNNFVPLTVAARKLGCRIRFSESEFSLIVDTPWRGMTAAPLAPTPDVSVDVHAPRASLSRWRSDATSQSSGGDISTSLATDLSGALGDGYWRAQIFDGIDARPRINELVWVVDRGPARWLVGQQRVTVNPLLPGFDLTGAQMAYTNSPDYLYAQSPLNGQLVPYSTNPLSVIRGQGPAGGIAELRLGGQVLVRQTIGLDGQYEFRNVPASTGDAIRLEVAIYEFRDIDVPMRVERVYSQASNLQLPEGTWVSFAGAGFNGRRLDSSDHSDGSAGFYQMRYGVSSGLTLDAVVQGVGGRGYGSVGAAASLGPVGTWAAYGARDSRGDNAYSVLGDGQRGNWFWHVNAQHLDEGFSLVPSRTGDDIVAGETDTRYAETGRNFGTNLRVSIVHGAYSDRVNGDVQYTKAAVDWRALPTLTLSARPDYRGDYAFSASWYPTSRVHTSLTRYADRTEAAAQYDINDDYRLMATELRQESVGDRAGVFVSHSAFGRRRAQWTLGVLSGEGTTGYLAEGALELRPGLTARLDVLKDPLVSSGGDAGPLVTLNVIADFAVTGSGLARGSYDVALRQVGGISGALLGKLPQSLARDTLAHIGVSINGQVRVETDAAGRFFIDDLQPGVYRLSLDPDNLPIEMSGSEHVRNVEVRAGATTRADFHLELRLGCAGRVKGYGDPKKLNVVVLDANGANAATASVSTYGFYRADGLKPGTYRIELRDGTGGAALASLPLQIVDRFVFGRDFAATGTDSDAKPEHQPQ